MRHVLYFEGESFVRKKIISVFLVAVMVATLFPALSAGATSNITWGTSVINLPAGMTLPDGSFTISVGRDRLEPLTMVRVEGGSFTLGWQRE